MYIPDIYKNENAQEIRTFLKANAFGIFVTNKDGRSCATHIPLEITMREDGKEILHGHISKMNEQVEHLIDGVEALGIFNGPHSYISASWYDFEEVSTWNYIAVQVRGVLKILDREGLYNSVKALMNTYEKPQENPVNMDSLSEKTMRQLDGIIGFEVEINSIEAAKKMSQNRDVKNHNQIIERLRENGNPQEEAVAKTMDQNRK
ncbi:FMN-binding negative transcriptional regulator [Dokdonia sp. Hel_I_53]|uniref:FMN-binding negative transcriptional regulator n=1 Tax=Dokdonia sp. Hel_I_53 TaxID=1566287 RepID=UPI00119C154C|nr:FMN-binding negative transcriptional regulator [Dokdonia sp. Hel_I_53]TVZ51956.1 PaiB family negative transcriptional regulator [Dokdonia sp. Hel_I_53]